MTREARTLSNLVKAMQKIRNGCKDGLRLCKEVVWSLLLALERIHACMGLS